MKKLAAILLILTFAGLTSGCEFLLYEEPADSTPTPTDTASDADSLTDGLSFDESSGFTSTDF